MFVNGEDGVGLREELGLTVERGNELMRITQSMMDQSTDNKGYGRTSHLLLSIAGRKDLNDVEKAACIFMFACKIAKCSAVQDNKDRPIGIPKIMDLDMAGPRGNISGMIVAPQGVDLHELVAVVIATLMSLIRQMPKHEAQDFCRNASLSFAKMAFTGDMKL